MKIYKDSKNDVYFYPDDGSQDHLIGDKVKITQQEANALNAARFAPMTEQILKNLSYADKRLMDYPPIGDQLDALWKGGAEAEAMKAKIQAVKAKYPK